MEQTLDKLFDRQVGNLDQAHVNLLYWSAMAEDRKTRYNITNAFDDLKYLQLTRTKQAVYAYIEALRVCCLIDIREEGNKKNLYITQYGARALETLVNQGFTLQPSHFLGG